MDSTTLNRFATGNRHAPFQNNPQPTYRHLFPKTHRSFACHRSGKPHQKATSMNLVIGILIALILTGMSEGERFWALLRFFFVLYLFLEILFRFQPWQ
jgi:hypothetical protein